MPLVVIVGATGTGKSDLSLDIAQFIQRDVALLPLNMVRREAAGRLVAPDLLARLADGRLQLKTTDFSFADAGRALDWIAQRGHRSRAVLSVELGSL